MSTAVDAIEVQALKLTPEERAELAERLLASVHGATTLDPEWEAEIERRVADMADMAAGHSEFLPAERAMAELDAHIASRRPA